MKALWTKYTLQFKRPAGTSRGVMKTKDSYFIALDYEGQRYIGECGLLRGLSYDDKPDYEDRLHAVCQNIETYLTQPALLKTWPSIRFAVEMLAQAMTNKKPFHYFDSPWAQGEMGIPINGLIWMGEVDFMQEQIEQKIKEGFTCIKLKIGAIEFEKELKLLASLRNLPQGQDLELRVDANGAFTPEEAESKLEALAQFDLHSIEQPVKPNERESLKQLAESRTVPVALDESLIGLFDPSERKNLLKKTKPNYIILKPSLLGGWQACREWIDLADDLGIGWWITSALESNIGLHAISQFTATFRNLPPQGLGTGSLYTNNFDSPLTIREQKIWQTSASFKTAKQLKW